MGGIKVYGLALSTCSTRVLGALLEKKVDYELISVDLSSGEHKQPPFLAKNPFGQIPVLEDGDLTLFDSRAITSYISYKYKDQGPDLLRLGNAAEHGLVLNWIEVESQQYNPYITPMVSQLVITPAFYGKPADKAIVDENAAKFEKVLDVYEARLSKSKYLAGDFFSLADLNHFPYTFYLMLTPYASLINSRPHVKAWWEAISTRPSFKKVAEGMTMRG